MTTRSPRHRRRAWRPFFETLECRALLTTITVESVGAADPHSLVLKYDVSGAAPTAPLSVGVYRSADGQFNPAALRTTDESIATLTLAGADDAGIGALSDGEHTKTLSLPADLGIDPDHPFVYAVVDPSSQTLPSGDLAAREGYFHKYVLGVVTHGYEFSLTPGAATMPAWVTQMATDLEQVDHYQDAIAFDWAAISSLSQPGEAVVAGRQMAAAIESAAQSLATSPTDVVDLHLIGHSRGAVVVSQALEDLFDAPSQVPAALQAGYKKVTLLDPHPAQPIPLAANGQPIAQWYSPGTSPFLSQIGVNELESFQAAMNDPPVVIPAIVNETQVFYQHSASNQLSGGLTAAEESSLFNLWGQVPVDANDASYYDLTGQDVGHEEVHQWYLIHDVLTDSLDAPGPNPGVHVSAGNASAAYVEQVFQDLLGRPADAGGLAYWATLLNGGAPRALVATAIDHSAEYYATNIVAPIYQRFLARSPDAAGASFWTGQLQAGLSDERFESQLIASPEYYARAGGSDAAWVDAAYQALLHRPVDPAGAAYWVARLAGRETRGDVANRLTLSDEGLRQRVVGDYMQLLGRQPDAAGLAFWIGQGEQGKTNEDILTSLVASDEYFQQHTGN
jgi:hypothetical protein